MTVMPSLRHRAVAKKPKWIIILVSLVCFVLIGAYVFPPRRYSQCYLFGSGACATFKDWLPSVTRRERTDEEIISSVVLRDILAMPMPVSKNPKIALMFLTPGTLPFEKLWEKFLQVGKDIFVAFVLFKSIDHSMVMSFPLTAKQHQFLFSINTDNKLFQWLML